MKTARSVGLALLMLVASSCGGGDSITVTQHVNSVVVAPSTTTIAPGATTLFTATALDAGGVTLSGLAVAWSSSSNSIATVSSGGTVTGVTAGTATITATIGGVAGTGSVTVSQPNLCAPVTLAFPGTVTGSVSASGCISNGNAASIYKFNATGSGGTTFAITSAFPSRLEVMTDPPGTNVALINTTTPTAVTGEWLLPAAGYQLRVSAVSGTGSFTLTGTSSNGASNNGSGCTAGAPLRVFVVGGTYTGQTLNTGDCKETDNSYYDLYLIKSLKPCTITMTPTGFDAYLIIFDASTGTNVVVRDASTTGVAETANLTACSNNGNALGIEANTFAAGETGTYSITISITGGGSIIAETPADLGAMLSPPIDVQRVRALRTTHVTKPPR